MLAPVWGMLDRLGVAETIDEVAGALTARRRRERAGARGSSTKLAEHATRTRSSVSASDLRHSGRPLCKVGMCRCWPGPHLHRHAGDRDHAGVDCARTARRAARRRAVRREAGRSPAGRVPRLRRGVDPDRRSAGGRRHVRRHAGVGPGPGAALLGVRGQRSRPTHRAADDGRRQPGGGGQPRLRHLESAGGHHHPRCRDRLRAEVESIPGAVVEPKWASVAVHYRLADPERHAKVTAVWTSCWTSTPGG